MQKKFSSEKEIINIFVSKTKDVKICLRFKLGKPFIKQCVSVGHSLPMIDL